MNWINDWIGVAYKPNGTGKDGYDCYGLVRAIYKQQLNIELPNWFSDNSSLLSQIRAITKHTDLSLKKDYAVEVETPKNFDFVMVYNENICHHIGLFFNGNILHVHHKSNGATFETLADFKRYNAEVKFLKWLK